MSDLLEIAGSSFMDWRYEPYLALSFKLLYMYPCSWDQYSGGPPTQKFLAILLITKLTLHILPILSILSF